MHRKVTDVLAVYICFFATEQGPEQMLLGNLNPKSLNIANLLIIAVLFISSIPISPTKAIYMGCLKYSNLISKKQYFGWDSLLPIIIHDSM